MTQARGISSTGFWFLIISCVLVYYVGLSVDLMDWDPTKDAQIALEMYQSKEYLTITFLGSDGYLDKPPLLFWTAALAYEFFEPTPFAYRFFSFLFSLLTIYSVYRFTALFYCRRTAMIAALVISSCHAMFVMNQQTKTDLLLTGSIQFTLWQLAAYLKSGRTLNVLLCSLGVGLGLLSKGPLGLGVPLVAFATHVLLSRDTKLLRRQGWTLIPVGAGVIILPFLVGLYRQHDWYGLQFFFWDHYLERFARTGQFAKETAQIEFHHFFESICWDFAPWTLLLGGALSYRFFTLHRNRWRIGSDEEGLSLGAFIVPFAVFSFSKFQLNHYIFVGLPSAAVIVAHFIVSVSKTSQSEIIMQAIFWGQRCYLLLIWGISFLILAYLFPSYDLSIWFFAILLFLITVLLSIKTYRDGIISLVIISTLTMIGTNTVLNTHYYPELLKYQATHQVGTLVAEGKIPGEKFYLYRQYDISTHFYARRILPRLRTVSDLRTVLDENPQSELWLYTNETGVKDLEQQGALFTVYSEYQDYRISMLTWDFLDPLTRSSEVAKTFLVKID